MASTVQLLPEITGTEAAMVSRLVEPMSDADAATFAAAYRERRKSPTLILGTALLGFVLIAGVQRFILGQTGLGVLYLLTGGLLGVGTVVDLVKHRSLADTFNAARAEEIAAQMRR